MKNAEKYVAFWEFHPKQMLPVAPRGHAHVGLIFNFFCAAEQGLNCIIYLHHMFSIQFNSKSAGWFLACVANKLVVILTPLHHCIMSFAQKNTCHIYYNSFW